MFSKSLTAAALALGSAHLAIAQTHTECNPMTEQKGCGDDIALGRTISIDFTKEGLTDHFEEFEGTTIESNDQGIVFSMEKETDAPTIGSNWYIFFGKVEMVVQAAPGQGIVTSVVLQSDNLDEIDWEWLGKNSSEVQTNYFGKGDDSDFTRGGYHSVPNTLTSTHKYTIDWTKESCKWYVDDNLVRELKYADAKGGSRYPQTPMQLRIGTWVAGSSTAREGTVEWAGGLADFSKGPSQAHYKSLTVTDYSNGVKGAKKYQWAPAPNDGSYQDITVLTNGGAESGDDEDEDNTTDAPKPSSTKTNESTKPSSSAASGAVSSSPAKPTNDPSATGGNDDGDAPAPTSGGDSASSAPAGGAAQPSNEVVGTGAGAQLTFSTAFVGAGFLLSLII